MNNSTTSTRSTLTVLEVARDLGIGRAQAYEAVKRGDIPSIRIGGRILIPRAAYQRMLERAGQTGEQGAAA